MKLFKVLLLGTVIANFLVGCERRQTPPSVVQAFSEESVRARIPVDIDLSNGKMGMRDFVRLLSVSDESIRAQDVEIALAKQESIGAWGIFEPEAYSSLDKTYELSQTSAEQAGARGTGGSGSTGDAFPYSESSTKARVGVDGKNPSGAKLDLFYEVERIQNTLQETAGRPSPEILSVLGASIILPILRNAGSNYNKAPIEISRINEEIAKETSRLVKSQRAFDGIKTYLMVQRAQSRVYWRNKAYETAIAIEKEISAQVTVGLRNSAELTEASAKVSEQLSIVTEARQNLNEQIGAFQIFFLALEEGLQQQQWIPSDDLSSPAKKYINFKSLKSFDEAMNLRPETRINALRIEREEVNILIAENQIKPEFNIKLDAKKTLLSDDYVPFREVFGNENPNHSWRVGFEYRRGIMGDIAKKQELESATLREKQAELTMSAFRQRIASEMNGIRAILARTNDLVREQNKLVDAYWDLYKAEENKSENGQSSNIEVFNRELVYYLAKEGQRDAIAQQNLSSYLASQISGTLLSRMGIE